ncbi:MAG: AraC family transcriptional regulator [Pseudopedobacter saltans]|uniref:AraC family transcriptional regulator n=1 Tax=Pseudopedobacter saltans TaxID=151895 RepID=A0A2W5GZY4_9SPHI|nr:MAG: AraC family transcriptional regulator [Pseudopedobacter saltans]
MEKLTSLSEFYHEISEILGKNVEEILPQGIQKDIGHFNVFSIADTIKKQKMDGQMPYNRRAYYKISLISGPCVAEYADKTIEVEDYALLFATPRVPYHWIPKDESLSGTFCVFTEDFLMKQKTGILIDELPIFKPGGFPIFKLSKKEHEHAAEIFEKIKQEINSDYAFKYDLLRNYVLELIHFGQKLQPNTSMYHVQNASSRIVSLFVELLERQFPIDPNGQIQPMRNAKDYADRLAVHVNHLNKVLKDATGKTTTEIINNRLAQEARILLKQTDWTVSHISDSLGFEEVAHFSNFFKKYTQLTPLKYRA